MKILMVTTVPITLEAFLLPLVDRLHAEGWRVDALTGAGSEGTLEVACHFDAMHLVGWNRSPRCLSGLQKFAADIRVLVEREGYDIVHVHTPIAAFVTRHALRKMRLKEGGPRIIYTVHGFHFFDGNPDRVANILYKTVERCAIHWTDDLVVMNDIDEQGGRAMVARTVGSLRPCRLHRIDGVGINLELYSKCATSDTSTLLGDANALPEPIKTDGKESDVFGTVPTAIEQSAPTTLPNTFRSLYDIPVDAFLVGMTAEMNLNKRHELVLRTAKVLLDRSLLGDTQLVNSCTDTARISRAENNTVAAHDTTSENKTERPQVHFLFIGTGPLESHLRDDVRRLGLSDTVHFAGQVSSHKMPDLLSLCDLGLLVSQREGLPRSLMEYVALNIPVAGTQTRGITDVVRDERALCDTTADALADMIYGLASDRTLREEIALLQHVYAAAHFAQKEIISRYLKLYCK